MRLNNNSLLVNAIEVFFRPLIKSPIKIRMLSPLTTYTTLYNGKGKKKTYYYSPSEKEFSSLICQNILKKHQALYKNEPSSDEFKITPLSVNSSCQKIINYKGTIIKGWLGTYRLEGNPELLSLAYDTGLGSKNPQDFGMFEIIKND